MRVSSSNSGNILVITPPDSTSRDSALRVPGSLTPEHLSKRMEFSSASHRTPPHPLLYVMLHPSFPHSNPLRTRKNGRVDLWNHPRVCCTCSGDDQVFGEHLHMTACCGSTIYYDYSLTNDDIFPVISSRLFSGGCSWDYTTTAYICPDYGPRLRTTHYVD